MKSLIDYPNETASIDYLIGEKWLIILASDYNFPRLDFPPIFNPAQNFTSDENNEKRTKKILLYYIKLLICHFCVLTYKLPYLESFDKLNN